MTSRLIPLGIICWAVVPFIFDNERDPLSDGFYRIVDERGFIGYADENGVVRIKPQFAMGMPFNDGKALVSFSGKITEVQGSGGEYHRFDDGKWFYIDKNGNVIEDSKTENR